jgi:hypothetical protein
MAEGELAAGIHPAATVTRASVLLLPIFFAARKDFYAALAINAAAFAFRAARMAVRAFRAVSLTT